MNIKIEITEQELKKLIIEHLDNVLSDVPFDKNAINIMVKSKQNYKSEWEKADFKATIEVNS